MALQEQLEFKSGLGAFGCIFGLFFAGIPAFMLVAAVAGTVTSSDGDAPPLVLIVPFLSIFIAVGTGVALGRRGTTIDPAAGTVSTWWGLLIPFSRTVVARLEDCRMVAITEEVRRSKNSSYTVYPARIQHEGEGKAATVREPRRYAEARRLAETVAKALDVGVTDATGPEPVVREAGTLDLSLAERLAQGEALPEVPDLPDGCRVEHAIQGRQATFTIPAAGWTLGPIAMAVLGGIVPLIGLAMVVPAVFSITEEGTPSVFLLFLLPFILVPLFIGGGLVFKAVTAARTVERIEVSPTGLEVLRTGPFGTKRQSIPAAELEELHLQQQGIVGRGKGHRLAQAARTAGAPPFLQSLMHPAIVARSDALTITFGEALNEDEARWLHAVLYLACAAGS